MNQPTATLPQGTGFGATMRKDNWWLAPIGIATLLLSFLVYSTWAAFQGAYYWVPGTNYLSPFYSPEFWGNSPHAIIKGEPSFWQSWMPPFSSALLILSFPAGFRLTCYYYRKAYYRSIWLDPVACAVGEPRKSYVGESALPLILWNLHRYFLYAAIVFVFLLAYDGVIAHMFPVNVDGSEFKNVPFLADGSKNAAFDAAKASSPHHHVFGMSLVSLILILNPLLLAAYTFGCHSLRHIVGGRKDCFAGGDGCGSGLHFGAWSLVSMLNRHHALFAMTSLVVVGLADVIVRLVAMGKISDFRFF